MKKEKFTKLFLGQFRLMTLVSLFLIIFSHVETFAQCTLACDDYVQVSVNQNCVATITPKIVLEDSSITCTYSVIVYDVSGIPLPTPVVNFSHVGKTLKVKVIAQDGNSCWGNIIVEDKFGPDIICPNADTTNCNNSTYVPLSPIVNDNCGGTVTRHLISDNTVKYNCDSVYAGKRTIVYFYTDVHNNSSDTCTQMIWFRKVNHALIVWPSDALFNCRDYTSTPPLSATGVPTIGGIPLYSSWGICNIAISFEDERINVCPGTFKVLRRWTLLDWCKPAGQNVTIHYQIIKVVDEEGPVVSCAPDMTVSTDVWTCTGTAIIAPPTIIRECSSTTMSVGYKSVSPNGDTTFNGSNTSNIVILANGFVSVSNLPKGLNWVIFRLTDQCGNYSDCATEVLVTDQVAPVAVCDQKTVVSLTVDGTAKVDAFTFDDGSHDNCAVDRYEVARMDNGVWGPYAFFNCADIGKTIMVSFRVWDQSNNSNTCMVEVVVQDKMAPIIFCPPNVTIPCEVDVTDLSIFGKVVLSQADRKNIVINNINVTFNGPAIDGYAYDACGVTITEYSTSSLTCGKGRIFRTFTAKDPNGLTSTCTQVITIQDFTPNSVIVNWNTVSDYFNNTTCLSKPDLTPAITGRPTITNADKCNNIAVTYEDLTFTLEPDACLKILRKWYVIDWCIYDPNASNPVGYWTRTQAIKISNSVPPNFLSNCADRTVDVYGPGCQGQVSLIGRASDDCTDSTDLIWYHEVDIDNNGSIDAAYSGPGKDASAVYPVGEHKVTFRVKDSCGNEKTCSFKLTVVDRKKPTPYCISSITTVIMPSTKSLEIWAKDYNLNSEDNCTKKEDLKYYFLINGQYQSSMTFTCANIGKNKIKMYVVDQAGNFDYCEVEIDLQDPNKTCPTGTLVSGKVITTDGRGVNNVSISWERSNPAGTNSGSTNIQGEYAFPNMTQGMDYVFRAEKNYDHLNGVSTQDILFIQKHILGQQTFDTPYKYIAADANNTKSITAADLSEIRKLILGVNSNYGNSQKSWRFIPVSHVFVDQTNPFPYPESISRSTVNGNTVNTDFYAVKIGDISGNAEVGNAKAATTRSNGTFKLSMLDASFEADQNVIIPITIDQDQIIGGFQMAFTYGNGFVFEKITSDVLEINAENYHTTENSLRISYVANQSVNLKKGEQLITLHFKSNTKANVFNQLNISYNTLQAEAYNENGDMYDIRLNQRENTTKESVNSMVLFQNEPNPFTNETVVKFYNSKDQEINFVIFDINGKVVRSIEKEYNHGTHELKLTKNELGQTGVYFIQMNTSDFTETKKMVLIR